MARVRLDMAALDLTGLNIARMKLRSVHGGGGMASSNMGYGGDSHTGGGYTVARLNMAGY